jgi:hypothetical protein
MDVAHGEMVENQLDAMIQHRARKGDVDPDEREPSYAEGVRRYNALLASRRRAEWCEYHKGQAARHRAVLESLIAHHAAEAERLAP